MSKSLLHACRSALKSLAHFFNVITALGTVAFLVRHVTAKIRRLTDVDSERGNSGAGDVSRKVRRAEKGRRRGAQAFEARQRQTMTWHTYHPRSPPNARPNGLPTTRTHHRKSTRVPYKLTFQGQSTISQLQLTRSTATLQRETTLLARLTTSLSLDDGVDLPPRCEPVDSPFALSLISHPEDQDWANDEYRMHDWRWNGREETNRTMYRGNGR
jgi:hypothetical protein